MPTNDNREATRIRKKLKRGTATDDEMKWLGDYDAKRKEPKTTRRKTPAKKAKPKPKKEEKAAATKKKVSAEEAIKALDKIRRTEAAYTRAKERLAAERKEWNARVSEDKVALKGVVEADTQTVYVHAENHLMDVQKKWQTLEETEAGRSMTTHECLEEKRKRQAARDRALKYANQMELPGV